MNESVEFLARAALIGAGATVLMDLWAALQRVVFGVPSLEYGLVGRWLAHIPKGRLAHESITAAPPIRGEGIIGWCAHYAIGIAFAALLIAVWGLAWAREPSLLPAMIVGLATVIAPLFVMQPALGLGVAASRTPRPNVARLRSALTHAVFGFGLYAAALSLAAID